MESSRRFLAALCLVLTPLAGCGPDIQAGAVGRAHEVSVVLNTPRDGELADRIRSTYAYPVDVVGFEPAFTLDFVDYGRFGVHRVVKNQIIAANLSRGDKLSRDVRGWLHPHRQEALDARQPIRVILQDLWAAGQTTLVLAAWSDEELLDLLAPADSSRLRQEFEISAARGLTRTLFRLGNDSDLASALGRNYGFTFKLLPGFEAAADEIGRVVTLSADDPGRILMIHWMEETVPLTEEVWSPIIASVLTRYNDGDFVDPRHTRIFPTLFQDEPALKWDGVWQNERLVIGGPFRAYAIHRDGRSYLLIAIIFAPGQDKMPMLRRIEGILATFKALP